MSFFKATVLCGAMITAGILSAQQPDSAQPDTSLTATPTPQASTTQSGSRRAVSPEKQSKRLAKELNLSREQVAQIRPILAERDQKVEQLRSNMTMTKRDRRAQLQALQQDSSARIEALLNDTQKQQYEQLLAARRDRIKHSKKA